MKKIISKAEGSAEVSSPPNVASGGEKKQIPTEADWEHIASQVRGTVFFGTPHKGSPFAGKAAGKFMDSAFRPSHPVSELMPGSKVLDALDEGFVVGWETGHFFDSCRLATRPCSFVCLFAEFCN